MVSRKRVLRGKGRMVRTGRMEFSCYRIRTYLKTNPILREKHKRGDDDLS